ncbi:MAG: hypothetical protein WC662_01345 [Candidatus Paceibacterota bacterium]|jgi:hypothetical protein
MKKNIVLFIIVIILVGLLFSVQLFRKVNKSEMEDIKNDQTEAKTPGADNFSAVRLKETNNGIIENNKYSLIFEEITKEEYENKLNKFVSSTDLSNQMLLESKIVSKNGECFEFKFENGTTDKLCDEKRSGDIIKRYSFQFEKDGIISMNIDYYEGSGNVLINSKTGEKVFTFGNPVFSPNNKRIISSSADLEAGYGPNGLQMYSINDDTSIELKWVYEQQKWEPRQVFWVDDNIFYVAKYQLVFSPESILNEVVNYSKITITEKSI